MTAVAEGASLFAESIDWSSTSRARKNTRGQISSGSELSLTFNYISRTPSVKSKIAVLIKGQEAPGTEFQIDSVDTGWTSGRLQLKNGATIEVSLTKQGDNHFKVFVFDSSGEPISLEQDKIVITRTAATVDAIPASHSIGIEVLEKLGGRPSLDYLVRFGDSLPQKGKKIFKAAESLKAGAASSINIKLWEGEITDPITDNRPIGVLKISGSDFDDGVIPAGADLECEYEILDSGNISLEISVPSIGGVFHSGKNFYSRQEGQLNFSEASLLVKEEGKNTMDRIDEISEVVDSPKLNQARRKLESAASLEQDNEDTESAQEAMENVLEARRLLAQVKKENLKEIRQLHLDGIKAFFDQHIREHARQSEESAFDNLAKTAQRSIDRNDNDFEHHLDELKGKNFEILWRQDWFVVERFKSMLEAPHLFADKQRFEELTQIGLQSLKSDDIEKLRAIVGQLSMMQIATGADSDMFDVANILRG
ncbi:MAG: hypothetical protein OEY59_11450 [Deltaproteobacteria bacterium]|nr:hypothetical protein [Deltaproteobacteria bacterium]